MNAWKWLTVAQVIAIHDDLIEEFGGKVGIMSEGALESTVNRPQQLAYYPSESSVFELAATLGYGLVKNHCFVDGNKRTSFDAMAVFLLRNGYELIAAEVEAVDIILDLVGGDASQTVLAQWLSVNCQTD